jgi:hypothetical protein
VKKNVAFSVLLSGGLLICDLGEVYSMNRRRGQPQSAVRAGQRRSQPSLVGVGEVPHPVAAEPHPEIVAQAQQQALLQARRPEVAIDAGHLAVAEPRPAAAEPRPAAAVPHLAVHLAAAEPRPEIVAQAQQQSLRQSRRPDTVIDGEHLAQIENALPVMVLQVAQAEGVDPRIISGILTWRGRLFYSLDGQSIERIDDEVLEGSLDLTAVEDPVRNGIANAEIYARGFCQQLKARSPEANLSLNEAFKETFGYFYAQEMGTQLPPVFLEWMCRFSCGPVLNFYALQDFFSSLTEESVGLFGEFYPNRWNRSIADLFDTGGVFEKGRNVLAPLYGVTEARLRSIVLEGRADIDDASAAADVVVELVRETIKRRNGFIQALLKYLQSDYCLRLVKRMFTIDENVVYSAPSNTAAFSPDYERVILMHLTTRMLFGNPHFFEVVRVGGQGISSIKYLGELSEGIFTQVSVLDGGNSSGFFVINPENLPPDAWTVAAFMSHYHQYLFEAFTVCNTFNDRLVFQLNKEKEEKKFSIFRPFVEVSLMSTDQFGRCTVVADGGTGPFTDFSRRVQSQYLPAPRESYFNFRLRDTRDRSPSDNSPRFWALYEEMLTYILRGDAVELLLRDNLIFQGEMQQRVLRDNLITGSHNGSMVFSEHGVRTLLPKLLAAPNFKNSALSTMLGGISEVQERGIDNFNEYFERGEDSEFVPIFNLEIVFSILYGAPRMKITTSDEIYFVSETVKYLDPILRHVGEMIQRGGGTRLVAGCMTSLVQGLNHCKVGVKEGVDGSERAFLSSLITEPVERVHLFMRNGIRSTFGGIFRFFEPKNSLRPANGYKEYGESTMCLAMVYRIVNGRFGMSSTAGWDWSRPDLLLNFFFESDPLSETERKPLCSPNSFAARIRDQYVVRAGENVNRFILRVGARENFANEIRRFAFREGDNVLRRSLRDSTLSCFCESVIFLMTKAKIFLDAVTSMGNYDDLARLCATLLGVIEGVDGEEGNWSKAVCPEDAESITAIPDGSPDKVGVIKASHDRLRMRCVVTELTRLGYLSLPHRNLAPPRILPPRP